MYLNDQRLIFFTFIFFLKKLKLRMISLKYFKLTALVLFFSFCIINTSQSEPLIEYHENGYISVVKEDSCVVKFSSDGDINKIRI
jgi:hypothetical protein